MYNNMKQKIIEMNQLHTIYTIINQDQSSFWTRVASLTVEDSACHLNYVGWVWGVQKEGH